MPPQNPNLAVLQQTPAQGFWDRVRASIANSALGYALQSVHASDQLGLTPTQTVYSPDYQAARNNLINPQFMIPASSTYHNRGLATARGALGAAGAMTSGQNLAMLAGAAATGGISAGAGVGINGLMALQGANNLYQNRDLHLNNAQPESYENLGNFLFSAGQLGLGARGVAEGLDARTTQRIAAQREANMVYRAQPLANAGEGVPDMGSHAQATNDPVQALQFKADLEKMTGVPHEVVRINKGVLPAGSFTDSPLPNSNATWTKFHGDVPEYAIDRTPTQADFAQRVYDAHEANGGATFSASGQNLAGTKNYAVSMFPDLSQQVGPEFNASHILDYIQRPDVQAQLSRGAALGTWNDTSSGKHYLDVSGVTPDRDLATSLGQQYNQKAIFDLNSMSEIQTGGTGESIPNLPALNSRTAALQPSFWQSAAKTLQNLPQPVLNTKIGMGFAAPLTLGDAVGRPDISFDPSRFDQEPQPGPSNILAPFGISPAARFKSVVPDSVAQHLTPGWENILKSPISQQGMLDYRKQIASPDEVEAAAQLGQGSSFNWYPMSRQVGGTLEDSGMLPRGMNANLFNRTLASTSPQTSVPRNLAESLELMHNIKTEQRFASNDPLSDPQTFTSFLDSHPLTTEDKIILPHGGDITLAGSKRPNLSRTISDDNALGGLKVSSFWGDLNQGNFGTMDSISQKGLGAGEVFGSKMGSKVFHPAPYLGARSVMSEVAARHGVSVDQIQASQWTPSRMLNDSTALQNATPAEAISHITDALNQGAPSSDYAHIALDALEGKHNTDPRYSAWKKDYERVNVALRQLHDNDQGQLDAFTDALRTRIKPLEAERASRPLGEPASRPLRRVIGRTQRSILASGAGSDSE